MSKLHHRHQHPPTDLLFQPSQVKTLPKLIQQQQTNDPSIFSHPRSVMSTAILQSPMMSLSSTCGACETIHLTTLMMLIGLPQFLLHTPINTPCGKTASNRLQVSKVLPRLDPQQLSSKSYKLPDLLLVEQPQVGSPSIAVNNLKPSSWQLTTPINTSPPSP